MVLKRDGFGGSRYYPENSELSILCTYEDQGNTFVIIQYLDLPFSYRLINRDGLFLLEEELSNFLYNQIDEIDEGIYEDVNLAKEITELMTT
ncbi:hypothetical protein ACJA3J_13855 [Halobacillus sp. SY10]|uniref:Uncharacterized protein n=2 Tax=Halobacillus TaxID=45667 RepID=A0A1H0JTK2_HALAD|nr:hypothetical protein [Halobacillus aidingensis]SDO46853.1 hypothetical protein SAMN05421677_105122 [Halobacillus aidingensis]